MSHALKVIREELENAAGFRRGKVLEHPNDIHDVDIAERLGHLDEQVDHLTGTQVPADYIAVVDALSRNQAMNFSRWVSIVTR